MTELLNAQNAADTRLSTRMTMDASYVGDDQSAGSVEESEYDRAQRELMEQLPSRQLAGESD